MHVLLVREAYVMYNCNMNIHIIYDTYSGGTEQASIYLANLLNEKGNTATIAKIRETDINNMNHYDLLILGTPSWWVNEKDGQPHESFDRWMSDADVSFQNKKVAIFGLGDESYARFCHGVDILEAFVKERGAEVVTPSLKMEGYLFKVEENQKKLQEWIKTFS